MNMCANHPASPAVAYCRSCGKPLCDLCRIDSMGAIYCAEHMPAAAKTAPPPLPHVDPAAPPLEPWNDASAWDYRTAPTQLTNVPSPYAAAPGTQTSPLAALLLGTIPGVGAIYNGQYAKGMIHAVIFGLLITIVSSGSPALAPLVGILIGVWWFYMLLEAYHTARKRREGLPVDEFSSILNLGSNRSGFPMGAVLLIGLGMLLLLDTTGLIPLERLIRYWPVALILLGVYMLYGRRSHAHLPQEFSQEFSDERR